MPKEHKNIIKKEISSLGKIVVIEQSNESKYRAPYFAQPKKNGTVIFIYNFKNINRKIKRKPYPMPKIQEMLLKLEGFKYANSLDLNMGYYHTRCGQQ